MPAGTTTAGTPSVRALRRCRAPVRDAEELATLIYTSGTTGKPKGVMHSFGNFAWAIGAGIKRIPMGQEDRMLSYLPLAHVVERVLVEHGWLRTGMQLFFADSLDTLRWTCSGPSRRSSSRYRACG